VASRQPYGGFSYRQPRPPCRSDDARRLGPAGGCGSAAWICGATALDRGGPEPRAPSRCGPGDRRVHASKQRLGGLTPAAGFVDDEQNSEAVAQHLRCSSSIQAEPIKRAARYSRAAPEKSASSKSSEVSSSLAASTVATSAGVRPRARRRASRMRLAAAGWTEERRGWMAGFCPLYRSIGVPSIESRGGVGRLARADVMRRPRHFVRALWLGVAGGAGDGRARKARS
jgi:hypothetical protein